MANKQTYTAVWIHVVWATKYRDALITKELKYKLYDYIRNVCKEKQYHLDFINGVENHVHFLFNLNPVHSISEMVKTIKGKSWSWSKEQKITDKYLTWQDGYSAFSVSPQNVQKVRNYIKNQEEHHKKDNFEEEINFLQKNSLIL